ncbi:MAG: transcription antitermination factor NusB [Pseudomonadota bacterium]
MSGAKARLAAAELLIIVIEERRMLDEALGKSEAFNALSGPDRGFARAMASAVLRYLGRLDSGLAPFLDRPIETATPPARALLRIGAAQAWVMETPDHAVVGETVAAAKQWPRAQRATGFLNAVLRKVVSDRGHFDAAPAHAIWPGWLYQDLSSSLGHDAATTLASAQMETPDIYLVPKDGNTADLAERVDSDAVTPYAVKVDHTRNVTKIPGYEEGDWWVQDVVATLPARLLDAKPGETVLDLCAAPGGKTMQLAASGASITAVDRSKPRLKRLKQNLWRTGFHGKIETVLADATQWSPPEPVDKILIDAPCSALGTLRRHPEGAFIKSAEDIARFPNIQARLLRRAADWLKPGGTLLYCVCSPRPQEGQAIIDAAIPETGLARLPIERNEVPHFEAALSAEGDLLTLPRNSLKHDAFYISRFRREI